MSVVCRATYRARMEKLRSTSVSPHITTSTPSAAVSSHTSTHYGATNANPQPPPSPHPRAHLPLALHHPPVPPRPDRRPRRRRHLRRIHHAPAPPPPEQILHRRRADMGRRDPARHRPPLFPSSSPVHDNARRRESRHPDAMANRILQPRSPGRPRRHWRADHLRAQPRRSCASAPVRGRG